MVKQQKTPYDKVLMAILIIFLLAGVTAPFATGYVNNTTTGEDSDLQCSVMLENAIARLIDKGALKLSSQLTSDEAESKIKGFLGSMPEINQQGYAFCLNLLNGTVNAKKAKGGNEIIINNISGD